MVFSVIIINYKTFELTCNCLNSLLSLPNKDNFEIILIDNASNDGSADKLLKEFGDKIKKIIINQDNLGFSGANNQGAKIADGEFLVFLNSDTIIKEDFLNPCAEILGTNEKIGIISPRLKWPSGENQWKAFGIFPSLWNLITQKTKIEPIINESKKIFKTDWVSGCALIIRSSFFKDLKGWDENFFLYYEDVDLCKRAKIKGKISAIALKASIVHLGGQSLKLSKEKEIIYYKSQDYYFRKHHGIIMSLSVKIIRSLSKIIKNKIK